MLKRPALFHDPALTEAIAGSGEGNDLHAWTLHPSCTAEPSDTSLCGMAPQQSVAGTSVAGCVGHAQELIERGKGCGVPRSANKGRQQQQLQEDKAQGLSNDVNERDAFGNCVVHIGHSAAAGRDNGVCSARAAGDCAQPRKGVGSVPVEGGRQPPCVQQGWSEFKEQGGGHPQVHTPGGGLVHTQGGGHAQAHAELPQRLQQKQQQQRKNSKKELPPGACV